MWLLVLFLNTWQEGEIRVEFSDLLIICMIHSSISRPISSSRCNCFDLFPLSLLPRPSS